MKGLSDMPHADALTTLLKGQPGLAEKLQGAAEDAAEQVTEEFFKRHQVLLARVGERGRAFTLEDVGHHVVNLAGAVAACSPAGFERYARWSARVLQARGMQPTILAESFSLIDSVLTPTLTSDEQRIVVSMLALASAACLQEPGAAPAEASSVPAQSHAGRFLDLILEGRRTEAVQVAREARESGMSLLDVYTGIVREALYEVGRRWETNRITVGTEHMATAIAQYVLARLDETPTPSVPPRGNILIMGVQGERHQVGANMAASVLEADGWTVRYLGTDLPDSSVLRALDTFEAEILCVCAVMLPQVLAARRLIRAVREHCGDRCPRLAICGAVAQLVPDIAAAIGADFSVFDLAVAPSAMRTLGRRAGSV